MSFLPGSIPFIYEKNSKLILSNRSSFSSENSAEALLQALHFPM